MKMGSSWTLLGTTVLLVLLVLTEAGKRSGKAGGKGRQDKHIGMGEDCEQTIHVEPGATETLMSADLPTKAKCKIIVKTVQGGVLAMSCPTFDLHSDGCKSEYLKVSGSGKFCTTTGPDLTSKRHKLKLRYRRKTEGSGGFQCQFTAQ